MVCSTLVADAVAAPQWTEGDCCPRRPVAGGLECLGGRGCGGSLTTDGNAALGSNTVSSRIYGGAVGADYRFSPSTLAGFALADGGTNFGLANGLGSGRSDLFQVGAFVRHNVGAAYVSAALACAWQDVTTDRTVALGGLDRLQRRFQTNSISGCLEGGYRFLTPWMGVTPYAAGQFTAYSLPVYAEQVAPAPRRSRWPMPPRM